MPEEFITDENTKEKAQVIKGKIKTDVLLLTFPEMEIEKGGIVTDEAKALSTRCHGYRIPLDGETSEMVWSPGIIGCLSETEKVEYCKLGTDWKKPSEKLRERMRILHEAGIFRKKKTGLGVGGEPRSGKPKTEEERRATHKERFGDEILPARGTGLK